MPTDRVAQLEREIDLIIGLSQSQSTELGIHREALRVRMTELLTIQVYASGDARLIGLAARGFVLDNVP